jgi:hypothetical protein
MYYSINGKLVDEKGNEIKGKNIEPFADHISDLKEKTKTQEDGLALLGNLSLDGVVSAKGFYMADGTKIPEVVKLPNNMHLSGKNIGIGVKKPESDLHMKGEFRVEGKEGTTQFNIADNNVNIIDGATTFKGSSVFEPQQLEIKNPKTDNNKEGSSTYFNYQKSGKNLISGKTVFSDTLSANDVNTKVLGADTIKVKDFQSEKSIKTPQLDTDKVNTGSLTTKSAKINGDDLLLDLNGKEKTILGFNRNDTELASVGYLDSANNDFFVKGRTNDGKIRLSVGSNGTKNNNLVISNDGNVGISKDDPKYKLDVEGAVKANKFINDKGEEIGKPNYDTKLSLSDGLTVKGGRSFFSDKDNKGKLRVGAYDGKPGIFSEDKEDLVLGVESSNSVSIGGIGNYFNISGSGDITANGDFLLKNKKGGAKIEGGNENHAIYFNNGLDGKNNQLNIHEAGSINMYTGGEINDQKKRMTIDKDGNATFYGPVKAKDFLDLNGQKIKAEGGSSSESSVLSFSAGGNDSEKPIIKKDQSIDSILDLEKYEIITSFTVTSGSSRYRSIFHYGNSNDERAPALWLYPNFQNNWKLHFRMRTSRNNNDGYDFTVPSKFRSLNLPISVKIIINKNLEKNNFKVTVLINGEFVSSGEVPAKIVSLRNRNLYIKSQWNTDMKGYEVNSLVFKAPTPPTDEERKLHLNIETNKKEITDKIEDIEKEFDKINQTLGMVDLGGNKTAEAVIAESDMIDKIFSMDEFSVESTIIFKDGGRNWRGIYHYGNSSNERSPAMWLYPNFERVWKIHFRIRTNRNHNDGLDFEIPSESRTWNEPHHIVVNVKKEYEENRIKLEAYVDGELAGERYIQGAKLDTLKNRKFYIKNPFRGNVRTGYDVEKVVIKAAEKATITDQRIEKKLENTIQKLENNFSIVNRTLGSFNAGSNMTSGSVTVKSDMLYEIMEKDSFEVISNITWTAGSRHWRNIYHYGNVNGERAPAMWFWPHFERHWKIHFRIRTNRNHNDGFDFVVPGPSRTWNKPHQVKVVVLKEYDKNRIKLDGYVDGVLAGTRYINGAKLENLKDRTLYLKDPWSNRDGYVLNSLVFLITKPPTEKELELEKSIDTVETDVKEMQDIVKKLEGGIHVGENLGTSSIVKKDADVDKALMEEEYTITSTITIQGSDRNWRNIYHYGNNNGERMPAMWIFPNNPWKMHFRIRTNRSTNDGLDFNIPSVFREYNKELKIQVKVSGQKKVHNAPGIVDVGKGNIKITAYVNDELAGQREWGGAYIDLHLGRNIYIKDPWYSRNNYKVHSLIIGGGAYTFKQDIIFENDIQVGNNIKLPTDAKICFGDDACFDVDMLKKITDHSHEFNIPITEGLVNRYTADSFKNDKWEDLVGDAHVKMHGGKLTMIDKSKYVPGDDGITKGFNYLQGNTSTRVEFPMNMNNENWTVVYVTRYDPKGRDSDGRILAGGSNWLLGHWHKRAGVCHQNGWLTHHDRDKIPEQKSWILGIEQPRKCWRRSNKHEWGKPGGRDPYTGGRNIGKDRLYINVGSGNRERADFNIAELAIYNRKLNDKEILEIKKYLEDRYMHGKGGVPEHTHDTIPVHEHEHTHGGDLLTVKNGIQNRYNFDSFKDGVWEDSVGKKNVRMHQGQLTPVMKSSYVKGGDGIEEGFGYLKGDTNVRLEFPQDIRSNNWTIVYVTRYDPQARDVDGRILQGGKSNWLAGHWHHRAGVSHQNSWVSHHDRDKIPEQRSWILGIEQPNMFMRRSGKRDWKKFSGGRNIGADRLYINAGRYGNERCDFNIAELIIYNRKISSKEIEEIKKYLEDQYIHGKGGSTIPDHTHSYAEIQTEPKDILLSNSKKGGEFEGAEAFNGILKKQKLPFYLEYNNPNRANSHRTIVYKRLTPIGNINMWDLFTTNWFSSRRGVKNDLNKDFKLYSSYENAVADKNPWKSCNYDDPTVGFPRDCGPGRHVGGQWMSMKRNRGYGWENWSFTLKGVKGSLPDHTHDVVPSHSHDGALLPVTEGLQNRYNVESFDGFFVDIGSNVGTGSTEKKSQDIDKALATHDHFTITSNIEINNNDRNWRNVYHYGNNNGERMPAMWIFPNNPWRMHFRLRTNRNHNDGLDFDLPGQFRKYNIPLEIKITVKGTKRVHNSRHLGLDGQKGSGNIMIEAFVNGVYAGRRAIGGAHYELHLDRKMYIKDPWYSRNNYKVKSLYLSSGKWKDSVTGNYANIHTNDYGQLTKVAKKHYIEGDDGLVNKFDYLEGNKHTRIDFPITVNNNNWTVAYVTRYNPHRGADVDGRILQGRTNWLLGHWHHRAGVCHQNGWVGHHDRNKIPEQRSWILGIEQPRKFMRRSAKRDWNISTGGGNVGSDKLYINSGGHRNETADFHIAELIVYNRKLDASEIDKLKTYLVNKYIKK